MHNGQIGGYERIRRRVEAMIDDRHYGHRLGTTDSEAIFYLMFGQGLDTDPVNAIARSIALIEAEMREAGIKEPLKFTAALCDGSRIFAIRHSTAEQAPSMYYAQQPEHYMVVSEPLDENDGQDWREVATGQMLIVDQGGTTALMPFTPRVE